MLSRLCVKFVGNASGYSVARVAYAPVRRLHGSSGDENGRGKSDLSRISDVESIVKRDFSSLSRSSVRWNSTIPQDFAMAKSQLLESLKEVKLKDAKDAPIPIFWSGVAGLIPIVVPPLTFLLFGYNQTLATIQMTFSATISAFLSGTKYGTHVAHPSTAEWPQVAASIVPQFVAFTGLILPDVIGYPLIAAAIAANGFIDLTSGAYPAWYKALRVGLTVPVLGSCLITCIFKLFNAV